LQKASATPPDGRLAVCVARAPAEQRRILASTALAVSRRPIHSSFTRSVPSAPTPAAVRFEPEAVLVPAQTCPTETVPFAPSSSAAGSSRVLAVHAHASRLVATLGERLGRQDGFNLVPITVVRREHLDDRCP
jgi:hypothetical protein